MNIQSAEFERLAEPPIPEWIVRVTVKGDGFVNHAVSLAATVGEVPVEGIVIDPDGAGFVGYLAQEPPEGSAFLVGYLDGELADSGLVYHAA